MVQAMPTKNSTRDPAGFARAGNDVDTPPGSSVRKISAKFSAVMLVRFRGFQQQVFPAASFQAAVRSGKKRGEITGKTSKQESHKKSLTFMQKITPTRSQRVRKIRRQIQNE
jgi:hypothetical protein